MYLPWCVIGRHASYFLKIQGAESCKIRFLILANYLII